MSKYGIISDIHANAHALKAVYEQLGTMDIDRILCLGDIVGYGPSPTKCLDLVLSYCHEVIKGNHDEAVLDPDLGRYFNNAALAALNWTREQLGPYHLHAISHMKTRIRLGDSLLLVHDTPILNDSAYIHELPHASEAFEGLEAGICLHGHTHLPTVFSLQSNGDGGKEVTLQIPVSGEPIILKPENKYLCNPGSVGQPRDADPRASFATLEYTSPDAEAIFTVYRIEYDIKATQAETHNVGLPAILAERLEIGS
ncbi:MAG TPA: metallophosphoesterase [Phycisphaerales bacterium]|jgi:predicted phosphodiesterase|nr:metallophosphoesterase [Phycisphaerales bacterium]HIN84096.1 metallophosphoesterase [Phycisphaerales bacterium]HIO52075.1 metallophosphoesterase [Phycisphaerales bacterium]